ncbi:uncharacterized protein LOC116336771 [Contarinia nasturtii]|uniref:uncharacterized protein LOC116336771 n=1 Tax=Contarinia nasturtii TaxID=265458 RepID=UPI0012D37852|nr:uncharacterized protein LOC116336771 [Contarinia nasturtii]
METIGEQFFETIGGLAIRFCSFSSTNTIEILIENLEFTKNRRTIIQHILITLVVCIAFNIIIYQNAILVALNIVFFVTIATKCYHLVKLIEFEKLHVIDGLSLQYTTKYCFGKRHTYIPIECIHDIIINEVIFGFRTIYILQVLTKGIQFQHQPVIPLLSELNPRIACIHIIYNLLRKKISNIEENRYS